MIRTRLSALATTLSRRPQKRRAGSSPLVTVVVARCEGSGILPSVSIRCSSSIGAHRNSTVLVAGGNIDKNGGVNDNRLCRRYRRHPLASTTARPFSSGDVDDRRHSDDSRVLWTPSQTSIDASNVTKFMDYVSTLPHGPTPPLSVYSDLHAWSVDPSTSDEFWSAFFDFAGIVASGKDDDCLVRTESEVFHKNRYFPDVRLNYAETLLRHCTAENEDKDAVVFWGEDRVKSRLAYSELRDDVARLSHYLRNECSLRPGDRVAGYVPNTPQSLIAMLAATSIGCVWSSVSPDFGVPAVLDRLRQIKPRVLFSADGYYYNGKTFDCLEEKLPAIMKGLEFGEDDGGEDGEGGEGGGGLEKVIVFPYAGSAVDPKDLTVSPSSSSSSSSSVVRWDEALGGDTSLPPLLFERVPFDHPLFVLFSSGTTGAPKCIVHGTGGTLIQHMKEHVLHCDVTSDTRMFYFSTCGWMMWNWQVSALASGATLLLYDGSPFLPTNPKVLWDYAQEEGCTVFGTSAKYIDALRKLTEHEVPTVRETHDLSSVELILSTGSPLVPESFDYVYSDIKKDVSLASISGGTDIVSCFVGGSPVLPVRRGRIACAGLGMDVDVYDPDTGESVPPGKQGELVCRSPFPSMPVGFWGDDEHDSKYRKAYFESFDNVWCQGDLMEKATDEEGNHDGGFVIYGRSDTTLNPGGVRIGTAEIYRQVERVPEVLESVVVGQRWDGDERVVLFVRLRDDKGDGAAPVLDDALREKIRSAIRSNTSPRHVPAAILTVPDVPRTKSGKVTEIAVRDVIHGRDVKNTGALANPEALEYFRDREELRRR